MKKVFMLFIMICFIMTLFSINSFASDIYNEQDEEGNIIIYPFKSVVKGRTVEGAEVTLNNESKIVGADGSFKFVNLDEGNYELLISLEGYNSFKKIIDIEKGKTIDLGFINLSKGDGKGSNKETSNKDTLDVSDPDYMDSLDLEEGSSDDSLFDFSSSFSTKKPHIKAKLAYLFIDYSRNIDGGGSINSSFNSNGFLTELSYKRPFGFMGHDLFYKIDTSFISGVSGVEKVYDNDILDSTLMVDISSKSFNGKIGYAFDIMALGNVYVTFGRNYDIMDIDVSSFEATEDPDIFSKEYRFTKGWSFGGGLDTDLSNFGFARSSSILSNISTGLNYEYTPTLTDITSTKDFSNILVEGNKSDFDLYISLNTDYQFTLGYKVIKYYTNEKIDGLLKWPSFDSSFSGPYVSFSMPF